MAWIESHQTIKGHPKTLKLSILMGWDIDTTIGKLHRLWWWCLDYCPDGCISRQSADMVALAIGLPPEDGEKLIKSLYDAEFLDKTSQKQYLIHDWLDYAGRYLRDTKYKRNPDKLQEIKNLYITIVSRQSADKSTKSRYKSAVPNQPTNLTKPTNKTYSSEIIFLSNLLSDLILKNNPHNIQLKEDKKESTILRWCEDIEKLYRIDNQPIETIEKVIRWCQLDSFWKSNILSGAKLREKWDKLTIKMQNDNGTNAAAQAAKDKADFEASQRRIKEKLERIQQNAG